MTAERLFLDAHILFSAAYQDGLARSLWTSARAGDDRLLATAVAARADVFLTGDRRHFGPLFGTKVRDVRVLAVRDYVAERGP